MTTDPATQRGSAVEPRLLPPNSIEHQYRGGDLIAALRGGPGGPNRPEEWLGSATTRFGAESSGLTVLDGTPLPDIIESDPVSWLGRAHLDRFGPSPALLVKLLHAGQRLPVHLHPTQAFASQHLDCPFGKSEAWYVLDRDRSDATVYVGTNRPVAREEWAELQADQNSEAMLELLNPVTVDVGDGVFVPAGSPHAIGEGLLLMELQEPTDFSILLEWEGFEFDGPRDGHLNLGFDVALGAINPNPFDQGQLVALLQRTTARIDTGRVTAALPAAGNPYFELLKANPNSTAEVMLPQSFGVLLVIDGQGEWSSPHNPSTTQPISRGDAYVVPHCSGPLRLSGTMTALFAVPPQPDTPPPVEFDS